MPRSPSAGRGAAATSARHHRATLPVRAQELRVALAGGRQTTVHLASYPKATTRLRVALLRRPEPLARWCRANGITDAIVGGFFIRPDGRPLGELRIDGAPVPTEPFAAPWDTLRAAIHINSRPTIARRPDLPPDPAGDLLQAGPLLVAEGRNVCRRDHEGFSAASHQFDSDITDGRYPRAALALTATSLLAVACDGRSREDAGMTLIELADFLVSCGARQAINLDGGGSASLVCAGRLRNRPREEHGIDLLEGRAITTALVFEPAARRLR